MRCSCRGTSWRPSLRQQRQLSRPGAKAQIKQRRKTDREHFEEGQKIPSSPRLKWQNTPKAGRSPKWCLEGTTFLNSHAQKTAISSSQLIGRNRDWKMQLGAISC